MTTYKNSKFQVSLDDEHLAKPWQLFQCLTREDRCVCVSSVERFGLSMEEYHAISQNIPNMEFELISSPKAE